MVRVDTDGEVCAHFEERISSADQHAADRDGTHNVFPNASGHGTPIFGFGICREEVVQLRAHEINEERNKEAPGEEAAGKLEAGEARTDDIADAEISRANARR